MSFDISKSDYYDKWLVWLVITTVLSIIIALIFLFSEIYIVFQNIFYIPIIIACVNYYRKGLYFSIIIAFVYLIMIFLISDSYLIQAAALLQAALFVIIAAVISYLSSRTKYHQIALTNSQEQYRTLVGNIPGVTYRCWIDKDWTMDFISEEIYRLTGYPVSDFVNNKVRSYGSIIHPQDRPYVKRTIFESSAKKQGYEIEYRIITSENKIVWVLEKGKGVVNAEGSIEWLDGVIIDITRHKELENELKEKENQYRSIIQSSFDMISLIDSEGKFLFCNRTHKDILGYSYQELVGTSAFNLIHPDDKQQAVSLLAKSLNEGTQETSIRHRLITKDRSIIEVINRIKVFNSKNGKPDKLLIIGIDITERIQTLNKIQQLKEDYEIVFHSSQDSMYLIKVDSDNKTVTFIRNNKAHQIATGISDEKIKDKTPQQIFGEKIGNNIANKCLQCIENKNRLSYEEELDLSDGNRCSLTTLTPVIREGKVLYIVGSSKDITKTKKTINMLHKSNERLNSLLANSGDILFVLDQDYKILEYYSSSNKDLITPPEEFLGIKITNLLFPPNTLDNVLKTLDRCVNTKSKQQIEYSLEIPDTGEQWYNLTVNIIEDKTNYQIICIINNVSKRKQTEQRLMFQYSFQGLIAHLSSYFLRSNIDSIDYKVNRALQKIGQFFNVDHSYLFRYEKEKDILNLTHEWCAQDVEPLPIDMKEVHCNDIPWFCQQMKKKPYFLIKSNEIVSEAVAEKELWLNSDAIALLCIPMVIEDNNFGYIGFESKKQLIVWDEKLIDLIIVSVQIVTEVLHRKQIEANMIKEKQKNTAMAMFVTANHEINQPLMVVRGYCELLEKALHDSEYSKYFDQIFNSIDRICTLLNSYNKINEIEFIDYLEGSEMIKIPQE